MLTRLKTKLYPLGSALYVERQVYAGPSLETVKLWVYAVALYVGWGICLSLWGALLTRLGLLAYFDHAQAGLSSNPWVRWDMFYYVRIAVNGYENLTLPFFPLYPALIRVLVAVGIDPTFAALLIARFAGLIAFRLLVELWSYQFGFSLTTQALLYLILWPAAIFLWTGYTEPIFLLLGLLALRAARNDHWWASALWGLGAGLTRAFGPALTLGMLPLALKARNKRALFAMLMPAIGSGLWMSIRALSFDSTDIGSSCFVHNLTFPGYSLFLEFMAILHSPAQALSGIYNVVSALTIGLLLFWGRKRLPTVDMLYALGIWLLPLSQYQVYCRPTTGLVRFYLIAYPIFSLMALWETRHPRLGYVLKTVLLFLNLINAAIFLGGGWLS